jgi:hypothetical protein
VQLESNFSERPREPRVQMSENQRKRSIGCECEAPVKVERSVRDTRDPRSVRDPPDPRPVRDPGDPPSAISSPAVRDAEIFWSRRYVNLTEEMTIIAAEHRVARALHITEVARVKDEAMAVQITQTALATQKASQAEARALLRERELEQSKSALHMLQAVLQHSQASLQQSQATLAVRTTELRKAEALSTACIICETRAACVLFEPCKHVALCSECYQAHNTTHCMTCTAFISSSIVFFVM